MKHAARIFLLVFVMIGIDAIIAQQPNPKPTPEFSTAEKIAIQSLESQKTQAKRQWDDANQNEMIILSDWQNAHPGFHVYYNPTNPDDPQQFTIQTIPSQAPPKPTEPASKPEPKK